MNKMNARITKVSDGEVVHSSVGSSNRACRWSPGPGVVVGGHQAAGKREMGNKAR